METRSQDGTYTLLTPPQAAPLLPDAPVVVLLGWAGASEGALGKYAQLLAGEGFTSVRGVQPTTALFSPVAAPRRRWALGLLRFLEEQRIAPRRPLVLFAFSNGGGTVVEQLLQLAKSDKRYAYLQDAIVGLAFDSAPGYMHPYMGRRVIATTEPPGLGRALKLAGWWASSHLLPLVFGNRAELYWKVWEQLELRHPLLFLYSLEDKLCDAKTLQQLIQRKRSQGHDVTERCWQQSQHCTHLRLHPEEYRAALLPWLAALCGQPTVRARL